MFMDIIVGGIIMTKQEKLYEDIHNYTKFKLVEMLIEKHLDKKLKTMNAIEQLADDVINVLSIAGLKYYQELKGEFDENRD